MKNLRKPSTDGSGLDGWLGSSSFPVVRLKLWRSIQTYSSVDGEFMMFDKKFLYWDMRDIAGTTFSLYIHLRVYGEAQ